MNFEKYTCKCHGTSWLAPSRKDKAFWDALFLQTEHFIPEVGMLEWLKKETELSEYDIKSIVGHVVLKGRKCKFCGRSIKGGRFCECRGCGAFNYIC